MEIKVIQKLIEKFEPNLILAIGGGTVIDYAKCVNCLNKKIKEKEYKVLKNGLEKVLEKKFVELLQMMQVM